MMKMIKTFAVLGFAAATLLPVAPVRAADTVNIGTVGSPSANLWPLFIGIEKGFYADANLKPELIFIPGKTISVGGPKDITRLYVDRMLAPQGLKSGDYDYHYAGATTARAQALLSGGVDAAILLPPSNFQVQNQGFNDLGLAMKYAPELAFSGTVVNRAWAGRSADVLKRVLAAQSKSTEYLYDPKNRAEVVDILVKVSKQKGEDVDKSYDFFNKNNFFDRSGKISRAKMNALIDALVTLGDVKASGNVERFLLPGVAQLSD
jgi:NitT/TauT family transport system substrate-binding protein